MHPQAAELPLPCSQCVRLALNWLGQLCAVGSVPSALLRAGRLFPSFGPQCLAANRHFWCRSSWGQLSPVRASRRVLCLGCNGWCYETVPVCAEGTGEAGKHRCPLRLSAFVLSMVLHPNHSPLCWSQMILSNTEADASYQSPASPLALF